MTAAYLIDPFAREVRRVVFTSTPGTADELHEICAQLDCDHIEVVFPFNAGTDCMYFDKEGRTNGRAQAYFLCRLWPHNVIAGKALWIGAVPDGSADPAMTIDYVCDHIVWAM